MDECRQQIKHIIRLLPKSEDEKQLTLELEWKGDDYPVSNH